MGLPSLMDRAGVAEFIMQEEFKRFSGFEVAPARSANPRLVVYEYVDESVGECSYCCGSILLFMMPFLSKPVFHSYSRHQWTR